MGTFSKMLLFIAIVMVAIPLTLILVSPYLIPMALAMVVTGAAVLMLIAHDTLARILRS